MKIKKSKWTHLLGVLLVFNVFMSFMVNAAITDSGKTYEEKISFLKSIGITEEALKSYTAQ